MEVYFTVDAWKNVFAIPLLPSALKNVYVQPDLSYL